MFADLLGHAFASATTKHACTCQLTLLHAHVDAGNDLEHMGSHGVCADLHLLGLQCIPGPFQPSQLVWVTCLAQP